jgi:hypothetical protein
MASLQGVLKVVDWQKTLPIASHKVMSLIERCHTASMGYHAYTCEDKACEHIHIQYHGCRNRHCTHCGSLRAQEWMEDRLRELLPVKYFHVVFTLPSELKTIAYLNRKVIFNLLFESSAHCILTLSKDEKRMGGVPSISSVLHTWGQKLDFHPHVHCIVSGGGINKTTTTQGDKELAWKKLKKGNGSYLFPYSVMEPIYKGFFLDKLNKLIEAKEVQLPENTNWQSLKNELYAKKWIVYAKSPMGNAAQVVEYLGRYTQKIAISNHRIKEVDADGNVTFWYKDYKDEGKRKLLKLTGQEFLRRFAQHILPARFVRIRHYGILGNYQRKERLKVILALFDVPAHPEKLKVPTDIANLCRFGSSQVICPKCKKGKLVLIDVLLPRSRDGPSKAIEKQRFGMLN